MEDSYRKAKFNYTLGLAFSLLSGIALYVERFVFTKRMDISLLGLNSIFENVFLLISTFDLGVTSYLYNYLISSINSGDEDKTKEAMREVKTYFFLSFFVVLILGLISAIFMPIFTKKEIGRETTLFFLIYLLGMLSQYYWGWRSILLSAKERNWAVSVFVQGGRTVLYILLIVVTIFTSNYLYYIITFSLVTAFSYFLLFVKVGRDYPYVRGLKRVNLKSLKYKGNILGMLTHRASFVFFRSFEPILVGILFGASFSGLYSNYLFFSFIFLTPFWIFQSSVTPSVLINYLNRDTEINKREYKKFFFSNYLISLSLSFLFLTLLPVFITYSFGKEYLLPSSINVLFTFLFFFSSLRTTQLVYRDVSGTYSKDWFKAVFEIVLSLVLSILFSYKYGIIGVPLGFATSYIVVVLWLEERTVMKYCFYDDSWDFIAKESFLTTIAMALILLWYQVSISNSFFMSVLLNFALLLIFLLLFFTLDRKAFHLIIGKGENG